MDRQIFIEKLFQAAKDAGISECEAYFDMSDDFSVDVLEGEIKEYTVSASSGLCFRGLYGGKMGYASTEEMDEEAVDMLIDGVKQNAMLIETDDAESIFEGSDEYKPLSLYSEEIASMQASEKIEIAMALEKAMKAADPRVIRSEGCAYESVISEKRIVNSKGLDVSYRAGIVGCMAAPIVSENDKVNFSYSLKYSFDKNDIDPEKVAKEAVEEALAGLNASSVPSGSYPVIFRNDVAAALLGVYSAAFSGESARKGLSLLKGREGEAIASETVTIIDDPLMEKGFASKPFDAEGVASMTKTVVSKGTLQTLLHNRKTAALLGKQTTGNASKAGYSAPVMVAPSNFYLAPGSRTLDEMIADMKEGLLITDLMGLHAGANQISGDFSLGAKGFRIENGKISHPVEQITVAGNFFELLKNIQETGSDLRFPHPGLSTSIGAPSVRIQNISVAGL